MSVVEQKLLFMEKSTPSLEKYMFISIVVVIYNHGRFDVCQEITPIWVKTYPPSPPKIFLIIDLDILKFKGIISCSILCKWDN